MSKFMDILGWEMQNNPDAFQWAALVILAYWCFMLTMGHEDGWSKHVRKLRARAASLRREGDRCAEAGLGNPQPLYDEARKIIQRIDK